VATFFVAFRRSVVHICPRLLSSAPVCPPLH
jgi:hypothetical protein